MNKAIVKSSLNKRGYYEIYFEKMCKHPETGLLIFKVGTGDEDIRYIPEEKIIKIIWDNRHK